MDSMPGLSPMAASAAGCHEWFTSLREAGFSRLESLYIITRPNVELVRLEWGAARSDGGSPA